MASRHQFQIRRNVKFSPTPTYRKEREMTTTEIDMVLEHRGVTVQHTLSRWEVRTNRHTTTSGHDWGWIEGAANVCWSNDGYFNRAIAGEICRLHNEWLENLRPIEVRIIEATRELGKLRDEINRLYGAISAAKDKEEQIQNEIERLKNEVPA